MAGVAALVLVAAVAVVVVVAPRGTSEISDAQAVDSFRADTSSGPVEARAEQREPSRADPPLPAPGVYTYAATGQEVVKLGPLPAETRPLPRSITAAVRRIAGEAACFEWDLNLFVEHTETTRFCADDAGLRVAGHSKHQKIGVMSPSASMECDPDVLPVGGRGSGDSDSGGSSSTDLRCRLELTGGPASMVADLAGTATAGAKESLGVGGGTVEAVPVTLSLEVSGDLSGSWTETTWWADDHTPVRVHRDLSLAGLASFEEKSELNLTSMTPAR